jgi:hypothetical protein
MRYHIISVLKSILFLLFPKYVFGVFKNLKKLEKIKEKKYRASAVLERGQFYIFILDS